MKNDVRENFNKPNFSEKKEKQKWENDIGN